MSFLGLEQREMTKDEKRRVVFVCVSTISLSAILVYMGVATPFLGMAIVSGGLGSSMIRTLGVSFDDHGWKGAVLAVAPGLVLMLLSGLLLGFGEG